MAHQPTNSALRALSLEFKSLQDEPVEGFRVKLVNEDNLMEWEVALFGPPETLYEGGYFKVSFWTIECGKAFLELIDDSEFRIVLKYNFFFVYP